jgi:hypothetical protein
LTIGGKVTPIVKCEQHPGFEPGRPAHDLGYCVLGDVLPVTALPIDGESTPAVGTAVTLAGFGQSSTFAKEPATLRMVDTTVVGIGEGFLASGSATATACRGDSGGPMLVDRGGVAHVAGIIEGATAAICGSPTQVVPTAPDRDWLEARLARDSRPAFSGAQRWALGFAAALAACLLFAALRARRAPRGV